MFKVGFTQRDVNHRAACLEANSPLPLRILGAFPGSRYDEGCLHLDLRRFRVRGEWFELPEPIVWSLLARFGVDIPPTVAVAALS